MFFTHELSTPLNLGLITNLSNLLLQNFDKEKGAGMRGKHY